MRIPSRNIRTGQNPSIPRRRIRRDGTIRPAGNPPGYSVLSETASAGSEEGNNPDEEMDTCEEIVVRIYRSASVVRR